MERSIQLGVGVLACVLSASVNAGVIHVSVLQPLSNSHGFTVPVELPRFDAALGTLQSIDFIFEVGYSGVSHGENTADHANKFGAQLDYSVQILAPNSTLLVSRVASFSHSGVLSAFDGVMDYSGASGYSVPFSDGNSAVWSSNDLAVLSQHTGPGTVSYSAGAAAQSVFEGGIGLLQNFQTSAYARISADYTFVAVPTPGGVALGVLALALLRRR